MIAFLYPGQGAQRAGMLANLPDSVATRRTMEEAAELLPAIGELDTTEVDVDHECASGAADLRSRDSTHAQR